MWKGWGGRKKGRKKGKREGRKEEQRSAMITQGRHRRKEREGQMGTGGYGRGFGADLVRVVWWGGSCCEFIFKILFTLIVKVTSILFCFS